jgi:capsular exopolysaccharide synthesis family protein
MIDKDIDKDSDTTDRMGLWEYLVVLRRRWWIVAAALVLSVGAALFYSLSATPQYLASADVLLGPTDGDASLSAAGRNSSDEIATQAQVVTSLPVARLVQQRWSLTATPDLHHMVSVQSVGAGRILRLTVRGPDRAQIATTANTVAAAYLQFRQEDALGSYQRALEQLSKQEADVNQQLRRIDALLAAEKRPEARLSLQTQRRSLLADLSQVTTQQDTLSDSLGSVTSGGELLRAAHESGHPVSPRTTLNCLLAAALGMLLGGGGALLRERLDDGVHGEVELRRALGNPLVLGRVPRWTLPHRGAGLVTLSDPTSAASAEYERLAVNVRFMLAPLRVNRGPGAVVLLTSGQQSEGTTSTACNLAVAGTRLGLRIVLVDADLRRAAVAREFGLDGRPGLSDLLVGSGRAEDCLVDVDVPGLRVMPAGTIPPNPAALLGSGVMPLVLATLAGHADVVLLDSPSVLVGADTLQLADHADMVVVVAREGVSRRRQLASVMESLRHVAVATIGVVINASGDAGRHTRHEGGRSRPWTRMRAAGHLTAAPVAIARKPERLREPAASPP